MTCDTRVRYECQITSSLWHQWVLKTCQNQLPTTEMQHKNHRLCMGELLWHRALCTVRWFLHHFEAVLKCYSFQLISKPGGFIFTFFSLFLFSVLFYFFCLFSCLPHPPTLLQWSTSRRCLPSLKALGPLEQVSRGILPLPHLKGALSSPLLRWRSPGASRWRCARCHENSALQTQKTGITC